MSRIIAGIKQLIDDLSSSEFDFVGQDLAFKIQQYIGLVSALIGTVVGFCFQNFYITFLCIGIGCGIGSVLTLFSWPWYRKNLIEWAAPLTSNEHESESGHKND